MRARHLFRLAAFLSICFLAACKIELHSALPETDANEIVARLLLEGISAEKEQVKGGVTVLVESADFARSVEILAHHGLPRRRFETVRDIFSSEGLVASPLQEWAKLNYAKAQELSQTISGIPGVIKADVHLGISRQESAFDETAPPSASVLIQMQKSAIYEELIPEIRKLVDLAHPDISYDRVGVVITAVPEIDIRAGMQNLDGSAMSPENGRFATLLPVGAVIFLILGGGLAGFLYFRTASKG